VFRRFAALLILAAPVLLIGSSEATWGAAPSSAALPLRDAHVLTMSSLATERGDEDRAEGAVVLVVLDGVRWQEVFYGADRALAKARGLNPLVWANPRALMPNLYRFLDTHAVGVGAPGHGADIVASGPNYISLPGYREIFAGRADPGCDRNDCARAVGRTIADDIFESDGRGEVAVVASWPNIARAVSVDPSPFALTAGRHKIENSGTLRTDPSIATLIDTGARASAWPGEGDYRPDAFTAAIALRYLATARPRFLFVGLGDADEHAHRNDYSRYLDAVHEADAFLGDLLVVLDGMGARGRHTTVVITADHGRAYNFRDHGGRYPESARVWLVAGAADRTTHGLVQGWRKHTLSEVAPTVRSLLGLPSDEPGEAIPEIVSTR
jgi:hypothetical protein